MKIPLMAILDMSIACINISPFTSYVTLDIQDAHQWYIYMTVCKKPIGHIHDTEDWPVIYIRYTK